ncbi:hypothetical protein J542_0832 [Acinetobacter baumannii 299505]|nr:hypothetical protein J542_0832 [Acinetobacter baumannii 299505]
MSLEFLNGVCRHELQGLERGKSGLFLNGVCRHELVKGKVPAQNLFSKWRMPP